jgi:O-antigen/teichoic acid export membrane protein
VTPFLLLLPAAIGYVAVSIFTSALVASGAPGRSSLGPLVSLVVATALDLLLIPAYGASGAAAAASIGYLAGGGTALVLYRRWAAFSWLTLLRPQRGDLDLVHALAGPLGSRISGWRRRPS